MPSPFSIPMYPLRRKWLGLWTSQRIQSWLGPLPTNTVLNVDKCPLMELNAPICLFSVIWKPCRVRVPLLLHKKVVPINLPPTLLFQTPLPRLNKSRPLTVLKSWKINSGCYRAAHYRQIVSRSWTLPISPHYFSNSCAHYRTSHQLPLCALQCFSVDNFAWFSSCLYHLRYRRCLFKLVWSRKIVTRRNGKVEPHNCKPRLFSLSLSQLISASCAWRRHQL